MYEIKLIRKHSILFELILRFSTTSPLCKQNSSHCAWTYYRPMLAKLVNLFETNNFLHLSNVVTDWVYLIVNLPEHNHQIPRRKTPDDRHQTKQNHQSPLRPHPRRTDRPDEIRPATKLTPQFCTSVKICHHKLYCTPGISIKTLATHITGSDINPIVITGPDRPWQAQGDRAGLYHEDKV